MSLAARRTPRRVVSEIDIQLWAREHRRRWLVRAARAASAGLLRMAARSLRPMAAPLPADPGRPAEQPVR